MQLGILSAPDGSQTAQFEHLKAEAHAFASNIRRQGLLTRNEVWTNLALSVNKTLECPMVTTRLSKAQWDQISTILHQTALPKSGFV